MAKKQERYKKVSTVYKKGSSGGKSVKLNRAELEEGAVASELLQKRSTSEFSRDELGALMQVPPGGAEPHQIKTQSRQFNRVAGDMQEIGAMDALGKRGTANKAKRPMSAKTPKIDLND